VKVGLRGDGLWREEAASRPEAARAAAASLRANGADLIKVYWLNNTFEGLAVDAAHAVGLPVTTHYLTLGSFARGLEGKEHANFYFVGDGWTTTWREDALALARAAATCITPTLVNYVSLTRGRSPIMPFDTTRFDDEAFRRYTPPFLLWMWRQGLAPLSPAAQDLWDRRFALSVENVRRVKAAGLRVATGTDWLPGWGVHAELELLVQAGFTPLEAIRAATLDAAACAGLEPSLGSIEPGKIADMVLVDGDPAREIRDTRRVHMVFLGGRPYTRDDIAAAWTGSSPARSRGPKSRSRAPAGRTRRGSARTRRMPRGSSRRSPATDTRSSPSASCQAPFRQCRAPARHTRPPGCTCGSVAGAHHRHGAPRVWPRGRGAA
jgi:hypothetical protein